MAIGGPTHDGLIYLLNLMRNGETPVGMYQIALVRTQPPGFTIGGEELDEPDAPEYYRANYENTSGNFELSDTVMTNLFEVSFPMAETEWGQINYWAITDSEQRVLFVGQLSPPLYVDVEDQVFLGPGDIGFDMTGIQWMTS